MIRSIRTYLFRNLVAATFFSAILIVAASLIFIYRDFSTYFDKRLEAMAFGFEALVLDAPATTPKYFHFLQKDLDNFQNVQFVENHCILPKPFAELALNSSFNETKFKVWDKNGQLVLHSASFPKADNENFNPGFSTIIADNQKWRLLSIYDEKNKIKVAIAENYSSRTQIQSTTIRDIVFSLFIVFPLLGLVIWFTISRGLHSIFVVAKEIRERTISFLKPVNIKDTPFEIQPLVHELNKLLAKLELTLEQEKRFAADAAHELKTPLAALKTQSQVAINTGDENDRQKALENIIKCVDRGTHTVQQLLTLSRMLPEALQKALGLIIVQDEIKKVISELQPEIDKKSIVLDLILPETPATIKSNSIVIQIMLRNLIDNAIRYNREYGLIQIILEDSPENLVIRIIDNGPGILPELRERVFERFFRIVGTNTMGSGLGLNIVNQIVKLLHGKIELITPPSQRGLEVVVNLPKEIN